MILLALVRRGLPEEAHRCFRSLDRDFHAAKKEALK
jgi:hypothetical protein